MCEPLEPRLLLAGDPPVITSISADNRGLVQLVVSAALDPTTIDSNAVRVYTAGRDGLLGTADDALASSVVTYNVTTKTIQAKADVDPGVRYRVQVFGDEILGNNGMKLDAEFNGSNKKTGDGTEGGTLQFFTRSFAIPIVRFTTIAGTIDVDMFSDRTPITVENFFSYMNRGVFDTTFFHRLVENFVIQGGGFTANNSFSPIPQDAQIQNEPGISNTRGTIAMAKLGGNPNSATNQFFFNLSNNAGNLDSQNGGFTVFAEIRDAAGLSVMDALAKLMTFDATSVNGAFSDLPVQDINLVENRGFPVPSDLALITRVAEIYDLTAEPFKQLNTQGQLTFSSQSGATQVILYSLTGANLGATADYLSINFSGDKLSSIKITGSIPALIGIQIISSQSVGSITDSRKSTDSNLAFIVSNSRIDSISLRGSIAGYDINDTLLAGGTLLPEDIDRDGRRDDPAAVVLLNSSTKSLTIAENLNGSVYADGGIQSVSVRGQTTNADFVLGPASTFIASVFSFGRVQDSTINSQNPISTLTAAEWGSSGQRGRGIAAPSLQTLRIAGDFQADLSLVGSSAVRALNSATIGGVTFLSNWFITGDVGNVNLRGGTSEFFFSTNGDAAALIADRLTNTAVNVTGKLSTLRTAEWLGGELNAGSLIQLAVTGGKGYSGDLNADAIIGAGLSSGTRSFRVAGNLSDATVRFSSPVSGFSVGGDVNDVTLNGTDFNALKFNRVSNLTFQPSGDVKSVTAWEWLGGILTSTNIQTFIISGNPKAGVAGDLSATVRLTNPNLVRIQGDIRDTTFDITSGRFLQVNGDVSNTTVNLNQLFRFLTAIVRADIRGSLIDSQVIVNDVASTLILGSMHNSIINVGGVSGNTFDSPGTQYVQTAFASSITVGKTGSKEMNFVSSSIVGNRINALRIVGIDTFNGNVSFGISARSLGTVDLISAAGVNRFSEPTDAFFLDDFEIRPNFVIPDRV